jgi:inner membrane transporter RhtA
MTLVGLSFGLGAALAFGGYTVLAGRVGRSSPGFSGLALSVTVGALVLSPYSVGAATSVHGTQWLRLAASGIVGVAIAFALTFTATRLTSARLTGTLLSVDPAMGALIGAAVLRQALSVPVVVGILLVIVSGAAVTWLAGRERDRPEVGAGVIVP